MVWGGAVNAEAQSRVRRLAFAGFRAANENETEKQRRRGPVAMEQYYTALESESNSMACFLSKLFGTRAALPAGAAPGGWGREPVSS